MIIDLNRYRRVIKPRVQVTVERNPDIEKIELIQRIATENTCPLIAVSHYMAELYGMTPELQRRINVLIDFYHVIAVINQEAFFEAV